MRIISDWERNFPQYLLARLLFVSVILGLALLFLAESPADRRPLLLLFSGNLFLAAAAGLWFKVRGAGTPLRWLTLSFGVVLDTVVIHYTGGAVSEFVFLYFFSIAAASLFLGIWGSVWIALLSEVGYALILLKVYPGVPWALPFQLFLYALYFALTVTLTGYLAEKLRARSRALEAAQRELSQTRLDTDTILKSLGTGLVAVTKTGEVLHFNPAGRQILGLVDEQGQQVVKEGEAGEIIRKFIEAMEAERTRYHRMEAEIVLPDGRCRPVGFSVFPLRDEASNERGKVILFTDLTAAKEEERERWRRERLAAVGELAKDLAHEIRNPLATISGCVEMLAAVGVGAVETKSLHQLALLESRRLNDLIRDFSTFARLEAPKKRRLNFSELLQTRSGGPVPLDLQLPPDLPVEADEAQLELITDALLMALSLWAEDGDRIEVRQHEEGETAISVQFRLPGKVLPDEMLDSIFQPFGGVSNDRLGLALPTALRAVEGHGGRLKLCSRPEKGTWFELVLESAGAIGIGNEEERTSCGT